MSYALFLAQVAAPDVSSSIFSGLLAWLLSPAGMSTAIGVILSGVGLLLGSSALRRQRVALAVRIAFHVVEDLATGLPDLKGMAKAVEGLRQADAWMVAHGWSALTAGEVQAAGMTFKAMNAQADAQKALAAVARPT